MKRYWVYGYAGELEVVCAKTARRAARIVDFAVAVVKTAAGTALTPDLWA